MTDSHALFIQLPAPPAHGRGDRLVPVFAARVAGCRRVVPRVGATRAPIEPGPSHGVPETSDSPTQDARSRPGTSSRTLPHSRRRGSFTLPSDGRSGCSIPPDPAAQAGPRFRSTTSISTAGSSALLSADTGGAGNASATSAALRRESGDQQGPAAGRAPDVVSEPARASAFPGAPTTRKARCPVRPRVRTGETPCRERRRGSD
jgi:hypothetical protein